MSVECVASKPLKIKYGEEYNLVKWLNDPSHVYVGRYNVIRMEIDGSEPFLDMYTDLYVAGKGKKYREEYSATVIKEKLNEQGKSKILIPHPGSIFANPFAIDKSAADPKAERDRVIKEFETDIRKKLADDPSLQEKLLSLKGKVLGCWCAPEPCHANILLKLIDEFSDENKKKIKNSLPKKEESKEQESKVESVKEKPKNTIESQSLTKEETKVESVKEKAKKKVQIPKNTSRKQSKSSAKSDQTLESLLSKRKKKVK